MEVALRRHAASRRGIMQDALPFKLSPNNLQVLIRSLETLGLPNGGMQSVLALNHDELKKAHYRRSLECHPDKWGITPTTPDQAVPDGFLSVQQAYNTLNKFIEVRDKVLQIDTPIIKAKEETVRHARFIAVGGAKGGVGKSFLCSSLAIALASGGLRVLAVDLDFGGANLHLLLGIKRIERTLKEFFAKSSDGLAGLVQPTSFRNLDLIGGDSAQLGMANHNYQQKLSLIRHLKAAPYDVVICDLGAGTSFNTLDYFLAAQERFAVTTTEPTSVLDTYALIKTSLYRHLVSQLKSIEDRPECYEQVQNFLAAKEQSETNSIRMFINGLHAQDPIMADRLKEWVRGFRINLILNQSSGEQDFTLIRRILDLTKTNLGVTSINTGRVPRDASVPISVARLSPFLASKYDSATAASIMDLASSFTRHPKDMALELMIYSLKKNAGVPVDFPTEF
jgi:flagellar biosynthesis protein FlhG